MLSQVLEICIGVTSSDANQFLESKILAKYGLSLLSWCIPVFKSISLVCDSRTPVQYPGMYDRYGYIAFSIPDLVLLFLIFLNFWKAFPDMFPKKVFGGGFSGTI